MSVSAASLRQSGTFRARARNAAAIVTPKNLRELNAILAPDSPYALPFRPMGSNSAVTDCNTTSVGTVIDMTAFDDIVHIDAYNDTVIVQAGVRIGTLGNKLARHGLELAAAYERSDRTVGGAIAGGCIGTSIGNSGTLFSSQVVSLTLVTPTGRIARIGSDKVQLLAALAMSHGMLGVVVEATLRVQPIQYFEATHRRCTIKQFAAASEALARSSIGVKFYVMPFRDRVYADLRRYSRESQALRKIPWKLKDWGESTVLPSVFKSLNKLVPVASARYRLIDEVGKATQNIVNNRLVRTGSNSSLAGGKQEKGWPPWHSTWLFPAADFAIVIQTYADFCRELHKSSGFRCDLPTIGFLVGRDRSALLSPAFEEPMFALRAASTQADGWEDFVLDFAEFAEHWGGSPILSQSRALSARHANVVFGDRAQTFLGIRRRLDPHNRFLSPFLSQYFL